jgi:hypothetical protein
VEFRIQEMKDGYGDRRAVRRNGFLGMDRNDRSGKKHDYGK